MLQFSFPVGRWWGIAVRAHISLLMLLALSLGYSAVMTGSLARGIALWLALMAAIAVREVARAIVAAYLDLPIRALFLLPIGGVMALAPRQGSLSNAPTRLITLVGSAANLLVALVLLGFGYGIEPRIQLLNQPWITLGHILRSAIWLQLLLAVVNLLPSPSLPLQRLVRRSPERAVQDTPAAKVSRPRAAFSLWTAASMALILAGIFSHLLWPVLFGITVLLVTYTSRAASAGASESLAASVRDVMLTEFLPLHASGTLRDAVRQTMHSVQEVFPVLRGERLVGWISRTTLLGHLRAEGDGFLQGAMTRSFQAVAPSERIGEALRRATALGAGEFIPVIEDGAMVGILTPGSLERAIGLLGLTRDRVEGGARQ